MKPKALFTVPNGEKVTEKAFYRVMISSVCSILLCMACLFGTTWAWFAVELVNEGNEIQIASLTADMEVKKGSETLSKNSDGAYDLNAGAYSLSVTVETDATDAKSPVYLVMTVDSDNVKSYYFTFDTFTEGKAELEAADLISVLSGKATVSFHLSWVEPDSADPIPDGGIEIGEEPVQQQEAETKEEPKKTEEEPVTQAPSVSTTTGSDPQNEQANTIPIFPAA